ncbi:hypothetical protein G6659_04165 [Polynucleobacter paneuropaeus]|nr:hypothetical protein G6659_04165 [Polynucleobacter paneuropaeus]
MKLNLKDITICAVDCVNPNLAINAITKSLNVCEFSESILFTDSNKDYESIKTVRIDQIRSKNEYSRFLLKDLYKATKTPFVLIVQWDGYVLESKAWSDIFYDYDYIGAKWPWHSDMKVGNGGFSLRSRKLLELMASDDLPFIEGENEDEQICRIHYQVLQSKYNVQFAPESIADQFAYERSIPDKPTFGFHGLFNMWRYLNDDEIIILSNSLDKKIFHSIEYFELVTTYYALKKFKVLATLFRHIRENCSTDEINKMFFITTKNAGFQNILSNILPLS